MIEEIEGSEYPQFTTLETYEPTAFDYLSNEQQRAVMLLRMGASRHQAGLLSGVSTSELFALDDLFVSDDIEENA